MASTVHVVMHVLHDVYETEAVTFASMTTQLFLTWPACMALSHGLSYSCDCSWTASATF